MQTAKRNFILLKASAAVCSSDWPIFGNIFVKLLSVNHNSIRQVRASLTTFFQAGEINQVFEIFSELTAGSLGLAVDYEYSCHSMERLLTPPPPASQPRFAALQYRNFTLLWSRLIALNAGTWMQNVAVGWLILQLTNYNDGIGPRSDRPINQLRSTG